MTTIFCYYCIRPLSEGENRFVVDLNGLYAESVGIPVTLNSVDLLQPMNICRKCYDRKGQRKSLKKHN